MTQAATVKLHLERRFVDHRVVFWHDPEGQYASDLGSLDLPGVTMLRVANDEYAKAIDLLEDMEHDVARLIEKNQKGKHLNERWHWQEVDRLNHLLRKVTMRKTEAKARALTYLTRAINTLDEIEDRNQEFIVKNENFKTFKIRLFQVYVSIQHDIHNYRPCIPILERYIKIDNSTKTPVWPSKSRPRSGPKTKPATSWALATPPISCTPSRAA